MAATASASAALAQSAVDPDLEDSNVSSPLTEVDDKDDNGEDIDHMQIDAEDGDNSSLSGDEQPADDNDRSESASVLSDAGSDDGNSDANDTEAETERLYDTPRNQRQRDVVIDQYNQGQVFEHTPSRLRRGAKPDDKDGDDEENSDRESVSGDEGSGASSAGDADDTPTKPSNSSKKLHDKAPSSDPHDRKRKRSPVADQSDTDQPQKKRTGSVGAASMDDGALNEDEKVAGNIESAVLSDADDEEASSNNRDTGTEGEALEQASRSSRSSRKSMRNGLRSKDSNREEEDDTGADAATETAGEEATDHQEDDVEADAEEETDAAAKNLEESKSGREIDIVAATLITLSQWSENKLHSRTGRRLRKCLASSEIGTLPPILPANPKTHADRYADFIKIDFSALKRRSSRFSQTYRPIANIST